MKKTIVRAALAAVSALGLFSVTSDASAASNTCWADRDGFCKTTCINADPVSHHVHINIGPWAEMYMLRDCSNGIILRSGSSGWNGVRKTITGLYASYTIYLYGALWPGGFATINNN